VNNDPILGQGAEVRPQRVDEGVGVLEHQSEQSIDSIESHRRAGRAFGEEGRPLLGAKRCAMTRDSLILGRSRLSSARVAEQRLCMSDPSRHRWGSGQEFREHRAHQARGIVLRSRLPGQAARA
jgi:hypothetical protein